MILEQDQKDKLYYELYKKTLLEKQATTNDRKNYFHEEERKFVEENYKKSNMQFMVISTAICIFYFLQEILETHKKNSIEGKFTTFYFIIVIFIMYITYIIVGWILLLLNSKLRTRFNKINSNSHIFLSLFTIYLEIVVVCVISFFEESKENVTTSRKFIFYDFYLIFSGCLIFLCKIENSFSTTNFFNLTNKIYIILYLLITITIIIFNSIMSKNFLILINSISLCILFLMICVLLKQRESHLVRKILEEKLEKEKTFEDFHSFTKILNVASFSFKNEEFLYCNEVGNNLLDAVCIQPVNKLTYDTNTFLTQTELRQTSEYTDFKLNFMLMNNLKERKNPSNKSVFTCLKTFKSTPTLKNTSSSIYKSLFKSIFMIEDTSKIQDNINNCKTKKLLANRDVSNFNIYLSTFKMNSNLNLYSEESLPVTKIEETNNKKNYGSCINLAQKKRNLYSMLGFLVKSYNSHSGGDLDCNCFQDFKGFAKLGIFEFDSNRDKKIYFEILLKLEKSSLSSLNPNSNSSNIGDVFFEFIFRDVSSDFDYLAKIEETEMNFKKNAHELKTPILSMLGCGEELKSELNKMENFLPDNHKKKIKKYVDHVTNLSSFIGYLIKSLSSKDSITKIPENFHKKISLNSLLKFCFDILETLLSCDEQKIKNVKIELKNYLKNNDVYFKSDEIQVKQILLNFISNSVKFTNYGRISISAKLKKITNEVLKIKIKDTGCGVKKEDSCKLFLEYSKMNNTKNNHFGTGLGLNICKTMAENLNMKIKFNSKENSGTKVCLYIFNHKIYNKYSINQYKTLKEHETNGNYQFKPGMNYRSASDNILRFKSVRTRAKLPMNEMRNILQINDNVEEDTKNIDGYPRNTRKKSNTMKLKKSPGQGESDESFDQNQVDNRNRNIYLEFDNDTNKEETIINHVMTDFNYSQMSYNSSKSSGTYDLEQNLKTMDINMAPNRTENKNVTFGINYLKNVSNLPNGNKALVESPEYERQENNKHLSTKYISSIAIGNNHNPITRKTSKKSLNKVQSIISPYISNRKSLFEEKILVVDDQSHSRRALVNLITHYSKENNIHYDIIESFDGIDCLNYVIKFPSRIRYIFIDENMNFMNGTETAEYIRKLTISGKIARINLILTSAADNLKNKTDLFNFYMTKPLTKDNIHEVFQSV